MRLAKQHHHDCIGVALPDFGQLVDGMAIACPDLAQIFARRAVQPIDRVGVLARGYQQFVERCPVVAPVEVEANALPQFFRVNLAPPPFVEDVLVAGENRFQPQHYGAVSRLGSFLQQRSGRTLRSGKRMVVTDENDVGTVHGGA